MGLNLGQLTERKIEMWAGQQMGQVVGEEGEVDDLCPLPPPPPPGGGGGPVVTSTGCPRPLATSFRSFLPSLLPFPCFPCPWSIWSLRSIFWPHPNCFIRERKVAKGMVSRASGGEEGTSAGGKGLEEMEELARALPAGGRGYERREPGEEDFERYKGYVGQKWTGVCKWFNVTKGFGFIVPDAEEAKQHADDVFVHQSSLQMSGFRSLDEGEQVEFTVQLGKRGLEAKDVAGLGGTPMRGHRIHPLGKRKEKEIRCYNCGQFGHHKASKCTRMPRQNVKVCYVCQSAEHLAADCPSKGTDQPQKGEEG